MELTYTRTGDYELPDVILRRIGSIGHYGRLRRDYLKQHRPVMYNSLILQEQLIPHLQSVDRRARQYMTELTNALRKERMIDETLKSRNPMRWVGEMNNIRACAEELVMREIVYG